MANNVTKNYSNGYHKPHIPRVELIQQLNDAIEHFAHILPAQASIRDFVHHNTLHGYESLPFDKALKESNNLTGAYGYWPQRKFREEYLAGRITNEDISYALNKDGTFNASEVIIPSETNTIRNEDIYRIALLFPLKKITRNQLKWQADEEGALVRFNKNIPEASRKLFLDNAENKRHHNESEAIRGLWEACIDTLGLDPALLHPEELVDLTPERAEKIFSDFNSSFFSANENTENKNPADMPSKVESLVRQKSSKQIDRLLEQVGPKLTLRTFLKELTGIDVQEKITAYLLPFLASWLDEGVASWRLQPKSEDQKGFYQAWKESALKDTSNLLNGHADWNEHIESLPDDPTETVMAELARMGIPEEHWGSYITRIALDLPGWSGMFYWRHQNTNYKVNDPRHVDMMDYLAVRLVLEHIHIRRLCRRQWLFEGDLSTIRVYLHKQYAESYVRYTLYNQHLPEYLLSLSQQLIERESYETHKDEDWQQLAHMIWTWQQCPLSDGTSSFQDILDDNEISKLDVDEVATLLPHHNGWKLFQLAQHLGLCGSDIRALDKTQVEQIFLCLNKINKENAGFLMLQAYEVNYRDQLFTTIASNQGRGTWADRENQRPEAQLIFCMDDREEGFRRHLEYLNPAIETLGAAAFFGVVMNWKGIVDDDSVVLCPVVSTPNHEIQEVADEAHQADVEKYKKRYSLRRNLVNLTHQVTSANLIKTLISLPVFSPIAIAVLVGKLFSPLKWNTQLESLQKSFDEDFNEDNETKKITRIISTVDQTKIKEPLSSDDRQLGYTIEEQVNIVESFLQNNGLLSGHANFVVMIGHYSRNQNNPHTAAYGCGACGGKFSGPNGRVFAAMANNVEVRKALESRDIQIPQDTWFIGAEHDTCNEKIHWTDTDLIPEKLKNNFEKLKEDTEQARLHSAHERCRKLASAPRKPSLINALKHIAGRAVDFSQARPELGHATIASGFIGRRHLTQGTFLDRRSFLISYDSNIDPDGIFLERILLSAGPVGAGINLEYYFSTVNNDQFGSSSKIVHNLAGLLGVMEGTSGDLRTGLPQQMIEIHEPMRLQLVVEATTEVLTEIYKRQPSIQQLVGNGWILLSAKDPESAQIHTFDPVVGWELWKASEESNVSNNVIKVKKSSDWYTGKTDHLPSVLVETVNEATHA